MKKKPKKVKLDREKMNTMFKDAGFTDEQIKEYYKNKEREKSNKKKQKKQIEKKQPIARIFLGLNTNSM
jgi:CRISPR/Cas system CSM-associated protein Csm2 small subunit